MLFHFCQQSSRQDSPFTPIATPCEHYQCETLDVQGVKEDRLKNVDMKVEGDILTIRVDLSKEFGPSASGKTIIIASTEGNVSVTDRDEKVGLNVYRKKP